MKRSFRIVMMFLAVFAPCACADSIPTFSISQSVILIFPNAGGDNEIFSFVGSGIAISGGGTAVCFSWCNSEGQLLAGSSLNPSISLVTFDNTDGSARIGGHSYNLSDGFLFDSSITALGSFTFPTSSKGGFTVTVPAVLNGPIQGFAPSFPSGAYSLQIPTTGTLVLTFTFFPSQDGLPAFYEFSRGHFSVSPVPEPGTLAMMGTGLCGIASIVCRKLKRDRSIGDKW